MITRSLVCNGGGVSVRTLDVPKMRSESECLIEVHYSGLNHLDFALSEGYGENVLRWFHGNEFVLGHEFSGVCVEVGKNVLDINVGDEVWGSVDPWSKCGTMSELIRVNEVDIARKPKEWSHAFASSIPFSIMTVWRTVIEPAVRKNAKTALVFGKGSLGLTVQTLLGLYLPKCQVKLCGKEGYNEGEKFDVVVDCAYSLGKPIELESFVVGGGVCVSFNSPWLRRTEQGILKGFFLFLFFGCSFSLKAPWILEES